MRTEYKRVVAQASEEALARWILKNLDWTGGNDDANGAFLTSILIEHRRQAESRAAGEAAKEAARYRFVREHILKPGVFWDIEVDSPESWDAALDKAISDAAMETE